MTSTTLAEQNLAFDSRDSWQASFAVYLTCQNNETMPHQMMVLLKQASQVFGFPTCFCSTVYSTCLLGARGTKGSLLDFELEPPCQFQGLKKATYVPFRFWQVKKTNEALTHKGGFALLFRGRRVPPKATYTRSDVSHKGWDHSIVADKTALVWYTAIRPSAFVERASRIPLMFRLFCKDR